MFGTPYASLRARLVANMVDLVVAGGIIQPAMFALVLAVAWVEGRYFPEAHDQLQQVSGTNWFGICLKYIGGLIFPFYWTWQQRSPGKRMRRLKIVDAVSGGRIAFWQAWLRYTVYFGIVLSAYYHWWDYSTYDAAEGEAPHLEYVIAAAFVLPELFIPFTAKRQGLHDLIARTAVVYVREKEAAHNQPPRSLKGLRRRIIKELLAAVGYYWFIVILIILMNTPFIGTA